MIAMKRKGEDMERLSFTTLPPIRFTIIIRVHNRLAQLDGICRLWFVQMSSSRRGSIQLALGPMFSGKSTELLRRVKRYQIANKRVALIKYHADTRYSESSVATHDKYAIPFHPLSSPRARFFFLLPLNLHPPFPPTIHGTFHPAPSPFFYTIHDKQGKVVIPMSTLLACFSACMGSWKVGLCFLARDSGVRAKGRFYDFARFPLFFSQHPSHTPSLTLTHMYADKRWMRSHVLGSKSRASMSPTHRWLPLTKANSYVDVVSCCCCVVVLCCVVVVLCCVLCCVVCCVVVCCVVYTCILCVS